MTPQDSATPPVTGMNAWNLAVGEVLKRTALHSLYGGAGMGGIEPSAKTPNVFIFTSDSGSSYGYNFDEELEDGSFLYTGDGQTGDQIISVGGNKAIVELRRLLMSSV
ncbi:MAG: hypothetical protein EB067_08145, partial [Actinobacteria bacterium]|nr:hypothetical protein [Actinomycetota bacterium]